MSDDHRERDREIRIIEGIKARDPQALRSLLDVCGPRVHDCLSREFDAPTVEDAMSRALDKVWAYPTFDLREGSLGGWFLRIAVNCAYDILRENARDPGVTSLVGNPPVPPRPARPSEHDRRLLAALHEVIRGLPQQQRRVIEMDLAAHGQPTPAKVVARRFGTTERAVRAARCRAKKAIRRALAPWFRSQSGDEADEE